MILLPRAVRVYFATQPTNLRQSFEGLTNQIRHALGYDLSYASGFVMWRRFLLRVGATGLAAVGADGRAT